MKRAPADVPTARATHHHRTRKHCAIARGGDVVREHVIATRDEVDELHLDNRAHPHVCRPCRSANDSSLGDWCVDHTLFTEPYLQSFGDLERPAVSADVFTKTEDVRVA